MGAPRGWLVLAGTMTAVVLALIIPKQVFDTNFYSLWEATNLLAGDHPYRDFFEWGIPLQAVLSAVMQRIVGNRMVGEFILIHWPFIIAGAVISFDLGYRLTRSITITALAALIALAVLPDMPTFHYPKLFLYPAAIWLAWRYLEQPGLRNAAALGLLTAVAFLFRHDHGVYIGVASVSACVLARWSVPHREWRRTLHETGAYTVVAMAILLPWLVLVQTSEGVPAYVRSRAQLFGLWAGQNAYRLVFSRNPLPFASDWSPKPKPGVVRFRWEDSITGDAQKRSALEQQHGLRRVDGPDAENVWSYEVENVYAPHLFALKRITDNTEGLEWDRLEALNSWLPAKEPARIWMAQISTVIPFLLIGSAGISLVRSRREGTAPPLQALRLLLAGAVLVLVDAKLFREASYAHLVAPLTAAMGAHFLRVPRPSSLAGWTRLGLACVVAGFTAVSAFRCMDARDLLSQNNLERVPEVFAGMLLSPPIDFLVTRAQADQAMGENSRERWNRGDVGAWPEVLLRYMHDCTASGDRVLVSGQTPFQMGYLIERPIAGGHLFWHFRWRSDPGQEAELLALLERQSVPFAFSTHDPVLGDLAAYPRLHQYFEANYRVVPGSREQMLVDARRAPTGTFGPYEFPCFK